MAEAVKYRNDISILRQEIFTKEKLKPADLKQKTDFENILSDITKISNTYYGAGDYPQLEILDSITPNDKLLGPNQPNVTKIHYLREGTITNLHKDHPLLEEKRPAKLVVNYGEPQKIYENPRNVFRTLMSIEYIKNQTQFVNFDPENPKVLDTLYEQPGKKNIGYRGLGLIYYDIPTGKVKDHFPFFNTIIPTYLSMSMWNEFENKNPVLEHLREHNNNTLNPQYIIGAEELNYVFKKSGINAKEVYNHYSKSDLFGFLNKLLTKKEINAKEFLQMGHEKSTNESMEHLFKLKI